MINPIQVIKHITSNQRSIFLAKLRNFIKRGIFRDVIASILIAISVPNLIGGLVPTLFISFLLLCIVHIATIYLSSKLQAQKQLFDAMVTFEEAGIRIDHTNSDLVEQKTWDWILKAQENKHGFFLMIQKYPVVELSLLKNQLSAAEANTIRSFLEKNTLIR